MKTIVLAALVALSAAPAAFAMNNQTLSNGDKAAIQLIVPGVDLSSLTTAQEGALAAVLYGDDVGDNKGAAIRSIVGSSTIEAARASEFVSDAYVPGNATKGHDNK